MPKRIESNDLPPPHNSEEVNIFQGLVDVVLKQLPQLRNPGTIIIFDEKESKNKVEEVSSDFDKNS